MLSRLFFVFSFFVLIYVEFEFSESMFARFFDDFTNLMGYVLMGYDGVVVVVVVVVDSFYGT